MDNQTVSTLLTEMVTSLSNVTTPPDNSTDISTFYTATTAATTTTMEPLVKRLAEDFVTMQQIFYAFILVFGLFGNTMTILILRRLHQHGNSSKVDIFFLALAVNDLLVLLSAPLFVGIGAWTGIRYDGYHDVICKTRIFINNVCAMSSAWVLVALSIQRALSVVVPHRVNVLFTPAKIRAIVLGIAVVSAAMYIHLFYGFEADPKSKVCTILNADYLDFILDVWLKVDLLLYSVCPFICLVTSNCILVWYLARMVKNFGASMSASDAQQAKRERRAKSITITTVVVSLTFIALTLPLGVIQCIVYIIPGSKKTKAEAAVLKVVNEVGYELLFTNSAINFYLYILTGSRFRNEFVALLCGGRRGGGGKSGVTGKSSATSGAAPTAVTKLDDSHM